ncbi:MAG: glycosyltransferase family 4 protein [bacterium]
MKVGLVHRFFHRHGAVPALVREWADHLQAAGHQVVVFASDVDAAASTVGRTYVPVAIRRGKLFDRGGVAFAARVYRALRRAAPLDAVLCTDSTAYFGVWLAGRRLRTPTIMALQGWIYAPGKRAVYPRTVTWVYKLSVHFCARLAPMVGCLSEEVYQGLLARGASADRLWLAPNCVDLTAWRSDKQGAHERDQRQVLYVGGFRQEKGIEVLMDAIPRIAERRPGDRVRIVGGDEPEDGPYHRLARERGVLGRIDFGGLVPRQDLPALYAAADVMVSPSLAEGHALAPMECLACGTPVVASDISGLRDTVEHETNGLLVPAGEPAALADALCRVLGDRGLLDRLSRAARPSVARFSWEGRIREFENLVAGMRGEGDG